jgi:hypothetical protein
MVVSDMSSQWLDLPRQKRSRNGQLPAVIFVNPFKKVECMNLAEQVRTTNTNDDTMYALVQCEEGNLKYEFLPSTFVKKIKLGPKDQLYIIPYHFHRRTIVVYLIFWMKV